MCSITWLIFILSLLFSLISPFKTSINSLLSSNSLILSHANSENFIANFVVNLSFKTKFIKMSPKLQHSPLKASSKKFSSDGGLNLGFPLGEYKLLFVSERRFADPKSIILIFLSMGQTRILLRLRSPWIINRSWQYETPSIICKIIDLYDSNFQFSQEMSRI